MGKAPDFTLNSVLDGQQEKVNLSELRGQHVLVMFYPVDFGYVTPTEFYSLAPLIPELSDMKCTLLAISTEHISSQMKSQITPRSQAGLDLLGVRLASDAAGEVARLYGGYKSEENLAFRASFLIDPEGYLVAIEKCDFPVGRSMEEQVRVVGLATGKEDDLSTSKSFSSVGNVSSNTSSDVSGISSRFSKNDARSVVSSTGSFALAKSALVKKSSS